MKSLSILILLIMSSVALAEDCRSKIGLTKSNELSNICFESSDSNCQIANTCEVMISQICEANSSDDQANFACQNNFFFGFIFEKKSAYLCAEFSMGDEQANFACMQNMYNGYSIE